MVSGELFQEQEVALEGLVALLLEERKVALEGEEEELLSFVSHIFLCCSSCFVSCCSCFVSIYYRKI